MRRTCELNPLECPKCKSSMRIVAFVTDPVALKQILQSLGLPQFSDYAKATSDSVECKDAPKL